MKYSKILSMGISGMMMLSIIAPAGLAFAEETGTSGGTPASNAQKAIAESKEKDRKEENFCASLEKLDKNLDRSIQMTKKFDERKDKTLGHMKDNWTNADGKREIMRMKEEIRRAEKYSKMKGRTVSDVKKQAIEAFKMAVNGADAARKTAVDNAVSTYRTSVEKAVTDRKAALDTILNAYKTSLSAAITKAKADCAGGVDQKTVKAAFQTARKAAQDKMKADRAALSTSTDAIKAAITTRNTAIKQAQDTFKTALEKAKADLKSVQ